MAELSRGVRLGVDVGQVRVGVARSDPHGILAPQGAVSHNQKGEPTALVVDDKNVARLRVLKTGRAIGNDWQVLDGLKPGDKLITEGLGKVVPDAPVMPQPAGQAPAAPASAAAH